MTRTVYIVPHTHWDREWYATFETFRDQLVQLWDQLLALTESDPEFRFLMDGQSVVIDDYLEIRPEARARLERAVRSGQIQVGPWYTLPDEFLVSGETLVRDLQRGLRDADSHGGSMQVGYLPDSFGHAAQMPQLYAQLGFRYAAIWRGVPLSIDRVAFTWEAPDGSRVLTAYMGNSYAHGVHLPTEAEALRQRIGAALQSIEPFKPTRDILLMNGNDHVLPQAALLDAVRKANTQANGTVLRLARLDDYLTALPEDSWPQWRGELRSSARANVLMGTLSVRVQDKQLYAHASRTLERLAEPLAALSGIDAGAELDKAWTLILQNAAHDTACGSGIDAVAAAARQRSEVALAIATRVADTALPAIAGEGEIWNPSPYPRQEVIETADGPILTPLVAGFSVAPLHSTMPSTTVVTTETRLENRFLAIELSRSGTVNVLDRESGVAYADLHQLVDEGDAGDEYNFSPLPDGPLSLEPRDFSARIAEATPVRGRLEVRFTASIPSGLSQNRHRRRNSTVPLPVRLQLWLDADSRRLDFELELENQASDHRLRVHFPLPFAPTDSAADTPYHVTHRPVVAAKRDPGAPEVELPTYPMGSFVDVSDGQRGMALITDGLHEYEVLTPPSNHLALTLLRAVGWLSRDDLSTRTGHAGPAMETPGAQARGRHRFRYSLFFHPGGWQEGHVWRAAESALLPLQRGRGERRRPPAPLVELEPASVQLTACLPTATGFELRLLNAADDAATAVIRMSPTPLSATRVTLAGEMRDRLAGMDAAMRVSLRAWEIATIRIAR